MKEKVEVLVPQSCLTLCDPMDCSPSGSFVHGDSPGKNTVVGCHFLLQGIFQTQGSNPGLLHCRQFLYCLSHQGNTWRRNSQLNPLKSLPASRLDWSTFILGQKEHGRMGRGSRPSPDLPEVPGPRSLGSEWSGRPQGCKHELPDGPGSACHCRPLRPRAHNPEGTAGCGWCDTWGERVPPVDDIQRAPGLCCFNFSDV